MPKRFAEIVQLVGAFLRRWIVYAAWKGQFERVLNATDLLVDLAASAKPTE